jgi:hypothetical protein
MTAIIAMPHFQNVFKTGTTGGMVSVVFSLYTVSVKNCSYGTDADYPEDQWSALPLPLLFRIDLVDEKPCLLERA